MEFCKKKEKKKKEKKKATGFSSFEKDFSEKPIFE